MNRSLARRVAALLALSLAGCSEITPSTDEHDAASLSARVGSPSFIQISSYTVFTDAGGANDVVASQVDLTQFGTDTSSNDTYRVFWNWDATDEWSGVGQTADACTLFDTDADGSVNFAICAQISNDPNNLSQIVSTAGSPWVFTCSDASNSRCTNPSEPLAYSATDIQSTTAITATDPFPNLNPDQDHPSDVTIELVILKSFLPPGANLINVCSYPSAINGGNNNPFDCVLVPAASVARLDLVVTSATTVITEAGQIVNYSYLVTNTGALVVTNVVVADQSVSVVTCPQTSLVADGSMACSGSHTVTAAELNGDSLVSAATVDSDETEPFAYRLSIPIVSSEPLALVVDPRTACRAYAAATASSIDAVTYVLKSGLINQLSYRSVVYFATLTAPGTEFSAVITQENGSAWQPLRVDPRSSAIYDASCRKPAARQTTSFDSTTGETTIMVKSATAGATYYLAVEYVLSDLLRKAVISPSAKFTLALSVAGVPMDATQRDLDILAR